MYFKMLSESINTTREDFFPETTDYWVPSSKAEGLFRTAGDFETLVDPVQWPKLLVLHVGDPTSAQQGETSAYLHTFKFGANETVSSTGIKPFTTKIGVGIEKDREILGCVMESMSIEAINKEEVSCTCSIIGSGNEQLKTAATPNWSAYTQPHFTFVSADTMTIGGTDRLSTPPEVEAFRLTLGRSWDADHYVLGTRFLYEPTLSGFATVEGSLDLSFTSEDEHERFLSAVDATGAGDQSSFAIVLQLTGANIESSYDYYVKFTIPKAYYTASTASVSGRDRITQTVEFRGLYDGTSDCACQIDVENTTTSYTSLS